MSLNKNKMVRETGRRTRLKNRDVLCWSYKHSLMCGQKNWSLVGKLSWRISWCWKRRRLIEASSAGNSSAGKPRALSEE
jgi:hypothetical protein